MRRRASLATESADRRVNNLAEHRGTESEAGRSQTGLDVESRFTEGRISGGSVASALFPYTVLGYQNAAGGRYTPPRRVAAPEPELVPDGLALLTVGVEEAAAFEELIDSGQLSALKSTDAPAAARADRSISAADYLKAQRLRAKLRAAYERLFAKFDAVLTPALGYIATIAPPLDADLETALAGDDPFRAAGNLLGLPAIALPGPLARGLPTARQLLGPAWAEELLCAAASALEAVTPWAAQRPPHRER